ncbi:MAG: hypothetical protein RIG63_04235 [Coleofasciculus chthonoplastes F3-SA18-01]
MGSVFQTGLTRIGCTAQLTTTKGGKRLWKILADNLDTSVDVRINYTSIT